MKYLLSIALALISLAVFSQGFPVNVSNSALTVSESRTAENLDYKMSREGLLVSKQITSYVASTTAPIAANTTLASVDYDGTFAPTGYGFYMRYVYIQANRPVSVRFQLKPNLPGLSADAGATSGVTIYDLNPIWVSKFGTASRPLFTDLLPMSRFSVIYLKALDSDTTKLQLTVTIDGIETAYNRDKKAQKALLFIGTSISRGTGATYTNPYNAWPQIITQYFINKGEKVSIINKSVSGGTSSMMVNAKNAGFHDVDPDAVSAVFVEHGMNNAVTSGTLTSGQQTTYTSDLKSEIDYLLGRYKKATVFVDGTSPAQNNTREASLVILRGLAQTLVSTYASTYPGRVVFVNTGNAFDRTVTTNFASTDTAGDLLHPSDVGHAAKAKVYTDYFDSSSYKLP